MRLSVIVSGGSVDPKAAERVVEAIRARHSVVDVRVARTPGDVRRGTLEARNGGCRRIIVVGGDGALHGVANGVAQSPVEIGLVPLGRGQDFARAVGLPMEWEPAVQVALGDRVRSIDLGLVHCRDHGYRAVKVFFVNVAETGLGAEIVRRTERARPWIGRRLARRVAMLYSLSRLEAPRARLMVDGRDLGERPTANLIVGNGPCSGDGLRPLPDARLDDGMLDVVRIEDVGRLEAGRMAASSRGFPTDHPKIGFWRARRVEISCDTQVPIEADGEPIGFLPAAFEIQPAALRVVVP